MTAAQVRAVLDPVTAVEALRAALAAGEAPGTTPPRTGVGVSAGELLLMPAEVGGYVGVKVASVGDGSAGPDVPRVQGVAVLMDARTLTPLALADAVALTAVRTAAVSALAVDLLAPAGASRVVVLGAGPQAEAHARAVAAVRAVEDLAVVGRDPSRVGALVERLRPELPARAGSLEDVARADVVACCTNAAEALFDSSVLRSEAAVVAVGSHHRHRREVDAGLVGRATTVVESRDSAFREAGDIVLAVADGVDPREAVDGDLAELVVGRLRPEPGRPRLFKSVGEAWEDVVLLAAAYRSRRQPGPPSVADAGG